MKSRFSETICAFFFCLFIMTVGNCSCATVTVDLSKKFQTIEGFGGGLVFGIYPFGLANKDELYDSIFNKAGVNIVRIENRYDHVPNNTIDEIAMMTEIQRKWPQVKVILTGWSPPKYLKSNDSTAGLSDGAAATLKKENDAYVYDKYGDWWLKSVKYYDSAGVKMSWLSIQNEPNWPADWRGCYLSPIEVNNCASYGKALKAVYAKIRTADKPVPIIGPDITGIGENYMEEYIRSPDMDTSRLSAICHHFYNGADSATMKKMLNLFPPSIYPHGRLLYQTEFLFNDGASWPIGSPPKYWFNHAQLIQSALVDEGVSMYNLFALAYKHASTHCFFSLDDENGGPDFTVRPIYYAFKHFSGSIHRGWRRVEASVDQAGLKISAFASVQDDSLAVIVVTGNTTGTTMALTLPSGFKEIEVKGDIYQTTESVVTMGEIVKKYNHEGRFSPSQSIEIAPRSITTIELTKVFAVGSRPAAPKSGWTSPALQSARYVTKRYIAAMVRFPADAPLRFALWSMNGGLVASADIRGHGEARIRWPVSAVSAGRYVLTLEYRGVMVGRMPILIGPSVTNGR
jgi:O-glycosyl hydrolase